MGSQPASLDHMPRFSMANCITIGYPNTYTAQAMSVDCFLKRVVAGQLLEMPYKDVWPDYTFPRVFKIPTTIDTFLFSAYCETLSQSYIFPQINDGVRYTLGYSGEIKEIKPFVARVPKLTPDELSQNLILLDKKIDSMWGSGITKIVVVYDCSRGLEFDKRLTREYDKATMKALKPLGWKIAKVEIEPDEPKQDEPGWSAWSHYTRKTLDKFYAYLDSLQVKEN